MSLRFDLAGRLDAKKRTPQGGLRVDANLTRTGVFLYLDEKGQTVREYRPPEEVFNEDSLESLRYAPVVVGHPAMIKTDNFQSLSVGVVGANVRARDQFVASDLIVNDGATVKSIEGEDLVEISCGYETDLDFTPGVTPEGERYDAIQRNIRYNHVGLGPKNWGRAGNEVRMHLDAAGNSYSPAMPTPTEKTDAPKTDEVVDLYKRIDAMTTDLAKVTGERDGALAELATTKTALDSAKGELGEIKAKSANLIEKTAVFDLANQRVQLECSARAVLGESFKSTKTDDKGASVHMTDREIMIAAIEKTDSTFKADGLEDAYIRGRFDVITKSAVKADAAVADLNKSSGAPTGTGAGTKKSVLDEANEKAAERAKVASSAGAPAGSLTRK